MKSKVKIFSETLCKEGTEIKGYKYSPKHVMTWLLFAWTELKKGNVKSLVKRINENHLRKLVTGKGVLNVLWMYKLIILNDSCLSK